MGYDLSQVYYHGSPRADVGKNGTNFIPSKTGRAMHGEGSYFTSDPSYASDFAENMHLDEISARNSADNPMFGATDNPPYNKEWGQTVYPVFLKKTDFDINDSVDRSVKDAFIKVIKNENPAATNQANRIEDNYNLLNLMRENLDAEKTSAILKESGHNTIGLPHGHKMVIDPDENVKSVFAEFKDKKGLMSGIGAISLPQLDINPVKNLKNVYDSYKEKQQEIVSPAADYMARQLDISSDPDSIAKKIIRTGTAEALDPVNYVEGIPGAIMMLLNLQK